MASPNAINAPADEQPIELESVRKLRLEPGDILVLRVARALTADQMEKAHRILHEKFPQNEVLVLGEDVDLYVVSQPEGQRTAMHPGDIGGPTHGGPTHGHVN